MQPPQGGFGYQHPPQQQQQPVQQPMQQPVQQYQQPVQHYQQPMQQPVQQYQQPMPQPQPFVHVFTSNSASDKPNLTLAWIGVLLIFGGLAAPWIDIGFFDVSGYEVLEIMGELADDIDDSGDDGSSDSGGGGDPDSDEIALGLALLLYAFGPLVFLLSAIISLLILLTGNSPRVIGSLHIAYAAVMLILGFTAAAMFDFTVSDIYGVGVYLCSGAGFLLYQR